MAAGVMGESSRAGTLTLSQDCARSRGVRGCPDFQRMETVRIPDKWASLEGRVPDQ